MRAAKTDANQRAIVALLRAVGCSVVSLHRVGQGVPDLLVGRRGQNWLAEVKMPGEKPNTLQRAWHRSWRGSVLIWQDEREVTEWLNQEAT